jgi:polyferredoxin
VVAFFALPLFTALVAGRAFCAGVCPQGALQDFMLVKPLRVPLWLEHGLSTLPFIFLGAGLAFAATGTGFIICRYDPFVPIFRLSGSFFILTLGGGFLLAGMFIGRPYCRFLCPYGAMLKSAALVSRWRVRVTPTVCTQCRLCEKSCPFGALRTPSEHSQAPVTQTERSRLGRLLALLPVLIAVGALLGALTSPAAARLHQDVSLADLYLRQKQTPVTYGPGTPEALALARVEHKPDVILQAAAVLRHQFKLATTLFGGWVGLVLGCKLIALSVRSSQTDYEPDRGACFACARCFSHCPSELTRRSLAAGATATPTAVAEEGP